MARNSIGVIIPTKNRPAELERMLKSLCAQTIAADEVIIVDQSDNEQSRAKAYEVISLGSSAKLVYILDKTITGAAQARNRAIDKSSAETLFFFDDDVVLDADFIKESLKVYVQHPEVAGVGGVITNNQFLNNSRIRINKQLFFRGIFKEERNAIYTQYQQYTAPVKTTKLSGGCCCYKREALLEEMFDERFDAIFGGYAIGEDIDLSLRISRNHPLLITPFARMEHHHGERTTEKSENQAFLEISSWTYIFLKTFRTNPVAWCSFIWLCFGWLLRALVNLIKGKPAVSRAVFRGLAKGFSLAKESQGRQGAVKAA